LNADIQAILFDACKIVLKIIKLKNNTQLDCR
jgi:hypothetical protein